MAHTKYVKWAHVIEGQTKQPLDVVTRDYSQESYYQRAIGQDYERAISNALPEGYFVEDSYFFGPAYSGSFDVYGNHDRPKHKLDPEMFAAAVASVDLPAIAERHRKTAQEIAKERQTHQWIAEFFGWDEDTQ